MEKIKEQHGLSGIFLSRWHPYAWIVLVVAVLFMKSLSFEFTHLDDKDLILDNYAFISNPYNVPQAFMSRVFPNMKAPYYRPLLTVSFMFDSAIGGASPFVYHVTNIVIHATACCLVFILLLRLGAGRLTAFFLTLFFAVHPALVQAVAWIPGRNDSLLAVFALVSFLSFLNYLEFGRLRYYLLHIVFLALALFTKETAVVIMAMCLLYLKLMHRKELSRRDKRLFIAGWAVVTAFWFVLRHVALRDSLSSMPGGIAAALFVSVPAVIQYMGKVVLPFNLSVFPIIKNTTFIYGVIAIALIIFALRRSKQKNGSLVLFGVAWFLLFLAPSLVRPTAAYVHDFQEHRMYLPMIGALIVFSEINFFKTMKAGIIAAYVAALCVLVAINLRHSDNFNGELAYWKNAVKTAPASYVTHLRTAYVYYENGYYDDAEREYRTVIKMDRLSSPAYFGLGNICLKRDMVKDAELEFRRAIAAYDGNSSAYVSLGTIYYRQGRFSEAANMWIWALRMNPKNVDALKNLAIFCAERKDYGAAKFYVDHLRKLGVEAPPEFLNNIGDK